MGGYRKHKTIGSEVKDSLLPAAIARDRVLAFCTFSQSPIPVGQHKESQVTNAHIIVAFRKESLTLGDLKLATLSSGERLY